ncbi:site-specific integrase [Paenibacillus crassostreae]|uniref:Integrase n=1 Tax=Paenibacillus crassostreae TaxID=1763538 RepID=A0A162KRK4_9BACL|nr:site-specific integrase [Paenibacillus crassostreae]AOZ91643.1 site-specific integrase [Paenibacillus crassostreae]OAB72783.1 integrase [Paenibacillus crassostreae]
MAINKDKNIKSKPWYFTIEVPENGERKRKKFRGFKTKKEAEIAQRELLAELGKGLDLDASKTLYRDFMRDYLNDKKTSVKSSTLATYSALVNNHIIPALGNLPLSDIKPRHIQNLYNDLFESGHLADENIQKVHSIINESLNKAAGWDMIIKNPTAIVDRPKARKKEMLYWSEEESHKFLAVARNDRYYHAFLLALTTGMRQGEILGLRWKDVDFERRTISIVQILSHNGKEFQTGAKTDSGSRSIGVDRSTIAELRGLQKRCREEKINDKRIYQDNDLVICTTVGTPLSPRNLNRSFSRLIENNVDIKKIRFHDLRHTHVVMLLKARENNKRIADRMGWSSVKMIDRYAHIMPDMQQETADLFGAVFYKSGAETGAAKEVN